MKIQISLHSRSWAIHPLRDARRRGRSIVGSMLVAGAFAVLAVTPAAAQDVPKGIDLLVTSPGTQVGPFPADFFFLGSDPVALVEVEGVPLDPAQFGSADTIVHRLQDAVLPACPGAQDTIDIQIIALQLHSSAPFTVTENGGLNPQAYELEICPRDPPQPIGIMTIICDSSDGGTFNSTLPVEVFLRFNLVGGPVILTVPWDDVLDTTAASWARSSTGFGLDVPVGLTVVVDCFGQTEVLGDGTSAFLVGVAPALPGGPPSIDCEVINPTEEELNVMGNGRHNVHIPGFPVASCCDQTGCCSELTDDAGADACIAGGGDVIGGADASCTDPAPGACCFPDNTCEPESNLCCCELRGGSYLGDGVACPDPECERPSCGTGVTCAMPCEPGCVCPAPPPPDPHATPGPTEGPSSFDFGAGGTSPPIPADFFGPGSDPFEGHVELLGNAIDPGTWGNASTLVQRLGQPVLPEDPAGTEGTVSIEIVALSLVSAEPITVTSNGGQNPEAWDVAVGLSDIAAPVGSLTATKTHANGGTFDTTLLVQPKLTFTKVDPPNDVRVLDTGLEGIAPINFSSAGIPFVHSVDPSLAILSPSDGSFVPGVEETVHGDPLSQEIVPAIEDDPGTPAQHTVVPASTFCGNNLREVDEQCDGTDDATCPGQCQANCTCGGPAPVCGNNVQEGTEQCDGTDDASCPQSCLPDCTCAPGTIIPTVSEWGVIVLTVLLLTAGTVVLGRRRRREAV